MAFRENNEGSLLEKIALKRYYKDLQGRKLIREIRTKQMIPRTFDKKEWLGKSSLRVDPLF